MKEERQRLFTVYSYLNEVRKTIPFTEELMDGHKGLMMIVWQDYKANKGHAIFTDEQ